MRVRRGFWRMCIFFDLQEADERGLLLSWSAEDLCRLGEIGLAAAAGLSITNHYLSDFEEIQSVLKYVREISSDCEQKRCLIPPPREIVSTAWLALEMRWQP